MFEIPAILKIISVFALILLLNRLRLHLSISLFIGSLGLGLWMGMGPVTWFKNVLAGLWQIQTIGLVFIIWLILTMSRMMSESGHMERIVRTFSLIARDPRTVGAFMAAFIGLLPMPGGALFSAPLVDNALQENTASREQKTILNYWFRHLWEYWWPLYPGVVLVVALLEVETWMFMAVMAPMTIIALVAGILFILRPLEKTPSPGPPSGSLSGVKAFIWEAMPIVIVIVIIIAQACLLRIFQNLGLQLDVPGVLSIIPGLIGAIAWVWAVNHFTLKGFATQAFNKSVLPMLLLIAVIMVFKEVMTESNAVGDVRNELITFGIPVLFVILIMPFISGLITGIAIGYVGASFPIIIPLIEPDPLILYLALAGLAYGFGFMGMMLSPVHLCLLVSKDYYKANLLKSYGRLIMPILFVLIMSSLLFLVTRALVI